MNRNLLSPICLSLFVLMSCSKENGPKLSEVSGTITFDGQALPNAAVMYQPEFGRPSFATTDSGGYYVLKYSDGSKGAARGTNTVTIRTLIEGEQGEPLIQKEILPDRYHDQTTLTANVVDGSNTIDFQLTSK